MKIVRKQPDESAISYYVNECEGKISEEEIINNITLMIAGGINEPRDSIGAVIYAFLALDRGDSPNGYDLNYWQDYSREVMRFFPLIGTAARMTTQDVELSGVMLPKGEFIAGCLSLANHDEDRYEKADQFDPRRKNKQSLAFAAGPHLCMGVYVGNQELIRGCKRLIDRLLNLRFADGFEPKFHGFEFRGLDELKVTY